MVRQTAVMMLCLVALVGCGSADDQDVADSAARFTGALEGGDIASACAMLAPRVAERMRQANLDCEQSLPDLLGAQQSPGEVQAWGDSALVRVGEQALFFGEFGSGWLVTGAGCRSRGVDLPYECAVGGP